MNYLLGKSVIMTIDSSIFSADTQHSPVTGKAEAYPTGMVPPMCQIMCHSPMQVFYQQQMIYRMAMAQAQKKTITRRFTPEFTWAEGN